MALSVNSVASRAVKWGVAVDLKRCVGCQSCTMACKAENGTPPGIFWTRVIEKEEGSYPFAYTVFMPMRCNHCSEPPCVPVCPTGASYQRAHDNVVLVDQDYCIGCISVPVAESNDSTRDFRISIGVKCCSPDNPVEKIFSISFFEPYLCAR